jgi:hypothetical protein
VKVEGELVDLLISVDPLYTQYVVYKKGKKVVYAVLNKALYGTVQASLLFWTRLLRFLVDVHRFVRNPYNYCVVNKMVGNRQCTVVWYIDDLKISHVDCQVVDDMIETIKGEFGNEMSVLVTRGKVHNYLGILIDYGTKGKLIMSMYDYIDELLKEVPPLCKYNLITHYFANTDICFHLIKIYSNWCSLVYWLCTDCLFGHTNT